MEQRYHKVLAEQNLRFKVSHVGVTRTLVSDLEWGTNVSADLADITYDLGGFNLPAPKRLTLSGLQVNALYDPKKGMVVDGIFMGTDLPSLPDKTGTSAARSPAAGYGKAFNNVLAPYITFLPEQVIVNNGKLVLTMDNKTIQIPFDISLLLNKNRGTAVCNAVLYPFGQPVTITSRINFTSGMETFRLEARSFELGNLVSFFPRKMGQVLSGSPDLFVEKLSRNNWQVSLSGLDLSGPDGPQIPRATARILKQGNQVTVLGELGLSHPDFQNLSVFGRTLLTLNPSGSGIQEIDLTCETQPMEMLTLQQGLVSAGLDRPQAALSLQIRDQVITGSLVVSFLKTAIQREGVEVSVEQGSVESDIQGNFDSGSLMFDLQSHLSGMQLKDPDGMIRFRRMDTAGTILLNMNDLLTVHPRVDLTTELISGDLTVPARNLHVQGIWARLPVTFPGTDRSGRFSVEKLMINNRAYLGGTGSIHRSGEAEIRFDGNLQVPDTDDLTIRFRGSAGMNPGPRLQMEAVSDRFRFSLFRFEHLMPQAAWTGEYDLDVTAAGHFLWENHKITTGADLIIHDGTLSLPDLNMTASGIRGRLAFKDLLAPASFPGQELTIDRIQAGDFNATDARIRFTLEPGLSLLLENARVNWAGGLVSTESIRIPSLERSAAVTFYCDRIQLTRLLEQIGGFESQGKGSLNGRIPLVLKDGEISFDNAFLFSTPGQGGRIVIHNTQKLVAGIPMNSPQFSQLDLAREALRDFDYTWARLTFNTHGDTLTMNMSLDGKPGRALPFVYKKEIGAFVRVDAQSPGSHFQGIKLDVNLNLPFNQVVTFGNKIQKLFK
ncbi:MAG: YdbH domain-containing protein, partial [Desulfotignum sp.]|nr:YdbH domain-containing protein [Desulfotignum sp.]